MDEYSGSFLADGDVAAGAAQRSGRADVMPSGRGLGTNTKFVVGDGGADRAVWRYGARVERYELQRIVARQLLPKERVRRCMLCASPGDAGVKLRYSPVRRTAHLAGLIVCGSVWICPVCAARVSERRRGEIRQALDWAVPHGMCMILVTYTLSHQVSDSLCASLAALNGAYRRMAQTTGHRVLRASYGLTHSIKATEVTWGASNGWHPHLHALWVAPVGVNVAGLRRALVTSWRQALKHYRHGTGRVYSASAAHGVDVRATFGDVQDYVSKMGRSWQIEDELTKANSKRGHLDRLTPFDLVRSVRDTDDQVHADLFREYAAAMKGTHQLRWSPGFKRKVGIVDRTDAELAADPFDDDHLAWTLHLLSNVDWAAVRYFNARAALETVGDTGDRGKVLAFLDGLRARYFAEGWGL